MLENGGGHTVDLENSAAPGWSGGGPRWPRPFLAAVVLGCSLFIASGVIARFADARFLLGRDFAIVLISLAIVELVFRGAVQWRLGFPVSVVSFAFFYTLFFASVLPGADILRIAVLALFYGVSSSVIRTREDVWTCVLGSWLYFTLAFFSIGSPYFATIVLAILMLSASLYWKMLGRGLWGALGALGIRKERLLRNVGIGILATILVFVLFFMFSLVIYLAGVNDLYKVGDKARAFPDEIYATATVLTPVCEETFFRGALFPVFGAIPSSLVFGLSHVLYGSWVEVVFAFSIGYFYCWLYKRTGSLIPSIVSHALFNAVSLIIIKTVAGSG